LAPVNTKEEGAFTLEKRVFKYEKDVFLFKEKQITHTHDSRGVMVCDRKRSNSSIVVMRASCIGPCEYKGGEGGE